MDISIRDEVLQRIKGLPAQATLRDILGAIRSIGNVGIWECIWCEDGWVCGEDPECEDLFATNWEMYGTVTRDMSAPFNVYVGGKNKKLYVKLGP